jgi:hypothetical protein
MKPEGRIREEADSWQVTIGSLKRTKDIDEQKSNQEEIKIRTLRTVGCGTRRNYARVRKECFYGVSFFSPEPSELTTLICVEG